MDVLLLAHEVGQRAHLHRGIGLGGEVPEAAARAGQVRVDRGVVDDQDALVGIALVVARGGLDQCRHHR
ncbi:hypothetical protein D3C72_2210210 [compost metagenome]